MTHRRWLPALDADLIARADEKTDALLATQVTNACDPDCGGFRIPEILICDPLGTVGACEALSLVYGVPGSRHQRSPAVAESVRRALGWFEARAQYDDGSLDGYGAGDMKSGPIAAFATFSFARMLPAWQRGAEPIEKEFAGQIRRIMGRSGPALRSGRYFTHNHRWAACAAMACVNDVAPDAAFIERIDDWLSDGIDQDSDGFYAEYSTGYGMLCDECFLTLADRLRRPALIDHVRRNLDLLPYLFHPNGEVACEYTYRRDQGLLGPNPTFLDMGARDGNGQYVEMARLGFELARVRKAIDPFGELRLALRPDLGVDPVALPDDYHRSFARGQVIRVRRGPLSATIMGRPAHPTVPFVGKPFNPNILAIRYGDAIIDGTRIVYQYYGDREAGVAKDGLITEGGEHVVRHDFTSHVDGPIPSREIEFEPDFHAVVRMREIEGGVAIRFAATGLPRVSVALEFAVRPDGVLHTEGREIPLADGEAHHLRGPARIVNGHDMLEIAGDIRLDQKLIGGGRFGVQPRRASLLLAVRTPYEGEIRITGRRV